MQVHPRAKIQKLRGLNLWRWVSCKCTPAENSKFFIMRERVWGWLIEGIVCISSLEDDDYKKVIHHLRQQ